MRFEVLGPLRMRTAAGAVTPPGRLRQVLLGVLLARANEPVAADALVDAMWTKPVAAGNLHYHVHRLRRTLDDPGRLSFDQGRYQLTVRPDELDAVQFGLLVHQASEEEPGRRAALLREAVALWRGTPFEGLEDVPLLADEARRLAERRLLALESLYEAELAVGRHTVAADLAKLVRDNPLRGTFVGLLMTALYRGGRRSEALEVYREHQSRLTHELGLDPDGDLRELQRRILAGEPMPVVGGERPAAPAQLPLNVRWFVARSAELAALSALDSASAAPLCVVAGTAGVGKTALVVKWAHDQRDRFPDGQLYVDLHGYGPDEPTPPEEVLAGFLRALGLPGEGIPADLGERSARFRSLVDGRKLLLVLDNARSAEQVRPLLPGSPSVLTLVTSRDTLAGLVVRDSARRIDLDRLPADAAATLVRGLAGDVGTPDAMAALVERCARLPLALRVAGELIRTRSGSDVADLVSELADEQYRLDVLDSDDPQSAVRAVFSWSYRNLPEDAARLFRLCGLHPGHDLDPYAMAALADTDLRTARRGLSVLLRAHLIEPTPEGRLLQHDLLRAYAVELAEATDSRESRDAALTRLFDYYLHTARQATGVIAPYNQAMRPAIDAKVGEVPELNTYEDALRWLDQERENLLQVARRGRDRGWPRYPATVSGTLWKYLDMRNYYDEALALHTDGLAAARELGDQISEGHTLRVLAIVHKQLGDINTAVALTEKAAAAYRAAGHQAGLATAMSNLAGAGYHTGRYRDAIRLLEQAIAIPVAPDEVGVRTLPMKNIGTSLVYLREFAEARQYFERALDLATRTGNLYAVSGVRYGLSQCDVAEGKLGDALREAELALDIATSTGQRLPQAEALGQLGVVHRHLGNVDESIRRHQDSVALVRLLGQVPLQAEMLLLYAETQLAVQAPAEALRTLDEAIGIVTVTGQRHLLAHARSATGDAHAALGNPDLARDYWRQAQETYVELDLPEATEVAAKLKH